MGLLQLNYKNNNLRSNKNLDYSHVQILVILSTDTRQLTSPFNISQLPKNREESSFKHLIKHLIGVRENPKFQAYQVRLGPKQNQLVITKHKSQPKI